MDAEVDSLTVSLAFCELVRCLLRSASRCLMASFWETMSDLMAVFATCSFSKCVTAYSSDFSAYSTTLV